MKGRLATSLGLLAAFHGCRQSDSVVLLDLDAGAGVPSVAVIRVTTSTAKAHDVKTFPAGATGTPVVFPASLVLVIPRSRSGRLDLVIEGIDVNSKTVASATAQTLIVVGDKVAVPVVLAAGPLLCGNGTIDPGESCDDGNLISFDGCDFRCQAESALPDAGPVDTARGLDVVPDARLDVSISDVSLDIVASDSTRLLDVTTLPEVAGVEVGRDVSPPQTDLDAAMPDFAVPTEPGPDLPLPNADGPAADVPPDIPSLSTLDAVGDLLPPPDAPTQAPSFRVIGEFVPGGFSAGATYKVIGRFVPFSGTTKGQTWGIGPL